jgi:hypothetical protein
MAQSYEEVRRQAKEYELQLQEIKAREIDQQIEDFKQTEEYKEFNKFAETYDPEKYRIATALFLDLVFQEINGYSYQKEPNEKAADMLNAYKTNMSKYLPEKFSPENLIIKKEEIIEVIESFPKQDIKDSKKDTKESYIGINKLYFHRVDTIEEYANDSLVTLDQINLVNITANFSMYNFKYIHDPDSDGDIINLMNHWYALGSYDDFYDHYSFSSKENSKNGLDYVFFYLFSSFENEWFDKEDVLEGIVNFSNSNSLNPNVFVDLYKQNSGDLLSFFVDKLNHMEENESEELNKINLFLDISLLESLFNKNTKKIKKHFFVEELIKKHNVEIHIYIVTAFFEYLKKEPAKKLKNFLIEIENNHNSKKQSKVSAAVKETIQEKKKLIKITKTKPLEPKTLKPFPRVVAANPKRKIKRTKVKPRKKQIATNKVNTASKNNINNDVAVEYTDPMVSINQTIGYNGESLSYNDTPSTKERKYFGIKNNKEYMELKNEIDKFNYQQEEVVFTEFSRDRKLSYEEGDEYYLERQMDLMDADLFSSKGNNKNNNLRQLKDKSMINYVNTENYTKVNQLISALSNQELELRNKHKKNQKKIDELIYFNNYTNTIKYLEDTNLVYRDEIKKIKKQINELLKIRQIMKDHKSDDVEYKRTSSSRKIVTDPNLIKEIEEDNIIYLSYEDFIIQKEIKAIIDYNNKKRKK